MTRALHTERDRFFDATPDDLIQDGVYKRIAVGFHPDPYLSISCVLLAKALGAKKIRSRAVKVAHGLERQLTKSLEEARKSAGLARNSFNSRSSSFINSRQNSMTSQVSTTSAQSAHRAMQITAGMRKVRLSFTKGSDSFTNRTRLQFSGRFEMRNRFLSYCCRPHTPQLSPSTSCENLSSRNSAQNARNNLSYFVKYSSGNSRPDYT